MWQTRAPPPRMAAHTAHTFVVHRDGCDWDAAAELLERDGFVVLTAAPDEPPLIPVSLCVDARDAACVYLEELLCSVERRGVQRSDEFRFAEVVHRDGLRYDLPIRWFDRDEQDAENSENEVDSAFARTAITHEVDSAFATLHAITHELARDVLAAVVERRDDKRLPGVTAPPIAGCVTSVPSASAQGWHSDGSEEGVYNFFVPLVSLQPSNGPTELRPGTHPHRRGDGPRRAAGGAAAHCRRGAGLRLSVPPSRTWQQRRPRAARRVRHLHHRRRARREFPCCGHFGVGLTSRRAAHIMLK